MLTRGWAAPRWLETNVRDTLGITLEETLQPLLWMTITPGRLWEDLMTLLCASQTPKQLPSIVLNIQWPLQMLEIPLMSCTHPTDILSQEIADCKPPQESTGQDPPLERSAQEQT
jgi:hypothetical protein